MEIEEQIQVARRGGIDEVESKRGPSVRAARWADLVVGEGREGREPRKCRRRGKNEGEKREGGSKNKGSYGEKSKERKYKSGC